MDALQKTQAGLDQVLVLQKIKQKKVNSIRSQNYKRIGLQQVAITDEDKKVMIAKENKDCDTQCSKIYQEINQARKEAGLPELSNPYKN